MKTLLLIRHAKSDWPENVEDFDRPLTEHGQNDANKMAHFLKSKDININSFVSSPAKRAIETCQIFTDIYQTEFSTEAKLYNPREINFENTIYGLEKSINTVAFFSHNNGISNFANSMTDEIINLPTCGVVAYQIDCENWSDFENAKKKFLYFHSPKSL